MRIAGGVTSSLVLSRNVVVAVHLNEVGIWKSAAVQFSMNGMISRGQVASRSSIESAMMEGEDEGEDSEPAVDLSIVLLRRCYCLFWN